VHRLCYVIFKKYNNNKCTSPASGRVEAMNYNNNRQDVKPSCNTHGRSRTATIGVLTEAAALRIDWTLRSRSWSADLVIIQRTISCLQISKTKLGNKITRPVLTTIVRLRSLRRIFRRLSYTRARVSVSVVVSYFFFSPPVIVSHRNGHREIIPTGVSAFYSNQTGLLSLTVDLLYFRRSKLTTILFVFLTKWPPG
jgi:hypothetical protein